MLARTEKTHTFTCTDTCKVRFAHVARQQQAEQDVLQLLNVSDYTVLPKKMERALRIGNCQQCQGV
jgi:hypothetical protein